MSIEELMQIDVTLGTRQPEPVRSTAVAIHVITAEDIRRAGVTTIADALALATGVHVARSNNGSWAISARGFNATGANKLLVMIDGRTVFSPLFTGTFWNMVDYVLEDIERIEVIRGPGATRSSSESSTRSTVGRSRVSKGVVRDGIVGSSRATAVIDYFTSLEGSSLADCLQMD